jgi:ligand-binding SRPBCC domain-containing protein
MATFERSLSLPCPVGDLFALLLDPRRTLALAPPELHLRLVEAPERLQLGSRLVRAGRRWGLPQRVVSEITALEPDALLVETQVQGPFRRWVHTSHLVATKAGGCTLREHIDFMPPGGVLGLTVTERFVLKELEWLFDFRHQQLRDVLGGDINQASGGP